jgi:cytochrome c
MTANRTATTRIATVGATCGALFFAGSPPAAAADPENGKAVFQACIACHTERPDSLGPNLRGVFGRKSAARDDFHYSNPMKRANLVWNEENLRAYITDPQAKVRGNRMPFGGLTKPEDIDDVIAYLKGYN